MSRFSQPQDPLFQALDRSLDVDRRLWPYDVAQSRAHSAMLATQGIISEADKDAIHEALDQVELELSQGRFPFRPDDVDIHMAIERRVTELAGRSGGKIHTGRSRNDQVATDLALYVRDHAIRLADQVESLARTLLEVAGRHMDWALPATRTCSAPSRSTSRTTCSPTSGCSCATASGSGSRPARPTCSRSVRAHSRA